MRAMMWSVELVDAPSYEPSALFASEGEARAWAAGRRVLIERVVVESARADVLPPTPDPEPARDRRVKAVAEIHEELDEARREMRDIDDRLRDLEGRLADVENGKEKKP